MTSEQMSAIARQVVSDLDLRSGSWFKARDPGSFDAKNLAAKFAGYMPDRVLQAVLGLASEMERGTPAPQDVLNRLRGQSVVQGLADPNTCNHPRPLAIIDERRSWDNDPFPPLRKDHPVGTRVGSCVRCATEIVFPPGKLLTVTETEARKRAKTEAVHA